MANGSDQFRQSDVTFWGMVSLCLAGAALLGANIAALLPVTMVTGLHATRLEGGSLSALRSEVTQLRADATRMRTENGKLTTMLTLAEQDQTDVTRRLSALETIVPGRAALGLDAEPDRQTGADTSAVTGAIVAQIDPPPHTAAIVTTTPMFAEPAPEMPAPDSAMQELPASVPATMATPARPTVRVSSEGYGVAIGAEVAPNDAILAWKDIQTQAGTLLLGLAPIIGGLEETGKRRIVAGPIESIAGAEEICGRLSRVGLGCLPVRYSGEAMPQ